jgi:transcription-repair coupling factor (superfamily II helicase)
MRSLTETLVDLFLGAMDPRWPSGFKSLYLSTRVRKGGSLLYLVEEEETAQVIAQEVDSLDTEVRTLFLDREGEWRRSVTRDQNTLFLARREDVTPEALKRELEGLRFLEIGTGQELDMTRFLETLTVEGYDPVGYVELPGEMAHRGGIVDLFPFGETRPLRIEFFGDRIESVREFDPTSQRSTAERQGFDLPIAKGPASPGKGVHFQVLSETPVHEGPGILPNRKYFGRLDLFRKDLADLKHEGYEVFFFVTEAWRKKRLEDLFDVILENGALRDGFLYQDGRIAVFSDSEVLGTFPKPKRDTVSYGERIEDVSAIVPGDFVVHVDYGIAKYGGLKRTEIESASYDCLVLRYRDGKVLIPSYNLKKVQRFVGTQDFEPALSELSSPLWNTKKVKARISAFKIVEELLRMHAERSVTRGHRFSQDGAMQKELEASFPHSETEDQERCIEEVKRDMESERVMDRLVAGEVGFGKTEVALRASFKAVMSGKQVALLVPTTILALQHFRTFKSRLEKFPVTVEMVSRLRRTEENLRILKDMARGKVDIVIGTHRLLQKDVSFKDLGLLIVDEEHRFGVMAKEKIGDLYAAVDVLRLTATPIPRTLYMALGRIYELSTILTPPEGRQEVETIVTDYDSSMVREAILAEIGRGGQVFFVHNRIEDLEKIERQLADMVPGARIGIAHGKMPKSALETVFLEFVDGDVDILVSTSIIEAGVDFPRANTLIVSRADLFGLAELHQLRGRVGRSDIPAHAYFLIGHKISNDAKRRLKALATYHHLGSGLKIALADLEIRGAGNLLGKEQHGHVNSIGYELYFDLLKEAAARKSGERIVREPDITLMVSALIPESYIEESDVRVAFYRKLSEAGSSDEVDDVVRELEDRFGPMPDETRELCGISLIRIWAQESEYDRVTVREKTIELFKKEKKTILRREIVEKMARKGTK